MQKISLLIWGLGAAAAVANAATTFKFTSIATLSNTGTNITINNAVNSTSTIDFTFTANSALNNTTFTLQSDTDGWAPDGDGSSASTTWRAFNLGTLTLDASESNNGNMPSCSNCGNILASIGLQDTSFVGGYLFPTVSTPNSPVGTTDPSGANNTYVTITPDGTTFGYNGNNKPPKDFPFLGAVLHIWLYTQNSPGSWDPFDLDSVSGGDRSQSQDLWMKIWLTGTPVTTPEPASMALAGAGLLALGYIARRRAASSKK